MTSQLLPNPRLTFLKVVIYTITTLTFFFSVFNAYYQRFQLAIFECVVLIASVILIIKLKKILTSKYAKLLTTGYTFAVIVAWIFTAVFQPLNDMVFFWYFPILVASYALNGAKIGFILTSISSVVVTLIFYIKLVNQGLYFPLATWLNTLIPSISIWIVVHIYEYNNSRTTKKLLKLTTHDTLTGLKDRHQAYNVYRHYSHSLNSLILLDIDSLHKINEKEGYLIGDLVLINIANILKQTKALSDEHQIFRFNGDEFAILLPNIDCKMATYIATVIKDEILAHKTRAANSVIQVSVSMGIACVDSDGYNFDELLRKASVVLKVAQSAGHKNKISTTC